MSRTIFPLCLYRHLLGAGFASNSSLSTYSELSRGGLLKDESKSPYLTNNQGKQFRCFIHKRKIPFTIL